MDLLSDPTVILAIKEIVRPVIFFLFAIAFFYFLWGLIRFLWGLSRGDEEKTKNGQKHMIYGVLGLGIMLSAFGIMNFIFNTVNSDSVLPSCKSAAPGVACRPSLLDGF